MLPHISKNVKVIFFQILSEAILQIKTLRHRSQQHHSQKVPEQFLAYTTLPTIVLSRAVADVWKDGSAYEAPDTPELVVETDLQSVYEIIKLLKNHLR